VKGQTLMGGQSKVDAVFVLMIFSIFATSVFLVIMLSGSTYSNMNEVTSVGQNERIALSYVRTKIRNADTAFSINVTDFHGISALLIEERFGEFKFFTYIYLYDGFVNEIFFEEGLNFMPSDGVPIIRAGELNFSQVASNLIRVETDEGSLLISPRSVGGGDL